MISYLDTLIEKYSISITHIKEYTLQYYVISELVCCGDNFNPRFFNHRYLKCSCCDITKTYITKICDCGIWDSVLDTNTNEVADIPDRYYFSSFKKYQS